MSPAIEYVARAFSPASEQIIERADAICAEYAAQGFDLTLRQLYYQFVARGFIPNRVEVWIEKDALVGVIEGVCQRNDVPFFSCRGYTSQSEMWGAGQRLSGYFADGAERVTIIHLGDHDPSGIDMSRDIEDRLRRFLRYDDDENGTEHADYDFEVERIALNLDQVKRLNPPPNPAKITDSRAGGYIRRFGPTSWELDALDPRTLDSLIDGAIVAHRDDSTWAEDTARQGAGREQLRAIGARWSDVVAFLDEKNGHVA